MHILTQEIVFWLPVVLCKVCDAACSAPTAVPETFVHVLAPRSQARGLHFREKFDFTAGVNEDHPLSHHMARGTKADIVFSREDVGML